MPRNVSAIAYENAPSNTATWAMPAEWSPHERTLMSWPTRASLWHGVFDDACREYAGVANAIVEFEPVTMVVAPGAARQARALLDPRVELVELPIDDSWMRDNGPIFVTDGERGRAGVHFRFNSWGERFLPYDHDAALAEPLLEHLGIGRVAADMVLEGGSISVDGAGTLITTEQCLLNPNRNPGLGRAEIERELADRLGVTTIVWLPYGHHDDAHTDGHTDGVCVFAGPGIVLAQSCDEEGHPDVERMAANRAVLDATLDAAGRRLQVVDLPLYPYVEVAGQRTMVSYVNLYLANGAAIVPLAEHPLDRDALGIVARALPDREVVGVPARTVAFGGGGVHCITQQVPA